MEILYLIERIINDVPSD